VELAAISHLVEAKGIHHLLYALARLRPEGWRLRIVGDGPELPHLQRLAARLRLPQRVEFLGLRNDVHEILRATDICVQPTLAEAFGYTIAEAMACGCAVVASRVGGIPEVIEHGKSGLLVEPRDEAGLAAALERLIAEPPLRRSLGEAARRRVCERFNLELAVERHLGWCEAAGRGFQGDRASRSEGAQKPRAGRSGRRCSQFSAG
jgi:glycosyltransferase involved in cell wall biosynthesis